MGNHQQPPEEEEWTVDDADVTIITDPGAEAVLELDPEPMLTDPGKAGLDVVFTAMSPAPETPSLGALPSVPVHAQTSHAPSRETVERFEAVLLTLEQECNALGEDPRAAVLHVEMGRILEERLGRARQAAQHFQKAFQLAPKDLSVLHASIRLFTQAAHWTMVAQLLGNLAEVTEEQQQRAAILSGRAQVLWDKLRDPDGAAAAFKEALAAWPAEPLALRCLEQILTSRVEYQPLFDAWVAAAAVESGARRLRLLERAAQLAEDRLRKDELSIQAWRDVLALEPLHRPALAALRRHYTAQKKTKELVELLTSTAVVAQGAESAQLLLDAARALKEDGQLQKALHAVQAALHSSADMPALWELLQEVHEAAGNFEAAAAAMHKRAQLEEEAGPRAVLLTTLGGVREFQLKAIPAALDAYRAALTAQRNHLPAVRALVRLLAKEGPPEELAEVLRLEATLEPARDVRLARLAQLADVLAFTLDRADEAVETLKGVLEQQRNHQGALEMMERVLRAHQRWPEMAVLLEQKILATENRDQRIMLYCRLAELHEEWLDDVQGAIDAYQRVIDLAPDHLEALRAVGRLQEKRGRYAEAVKATEMEVQATADRKARVPAMLRMAWLQEHHLGDDQAAVSSLERLLTYQGGVTPALRSLQRLYERLGRHGDLIFALRRELETMRSLEDGVPLLRRMAKAAHPLQNDVEAAIRTWKEVLERAPRDLEALDELASLYALKQDRDAQAQTLLRAAATFPPGRDRHGRLLQAAGLYEGPLKRPDRAVELFEEILRDGGFDEAALNGVTRVLGAQNRWSDLLNVLKATADAPTGDDLRAQLLVKAAVVARDRMARPDVAQENFTAALALRLADPDILAALENLQLSQRQWERAVSTGMARTRAESDAQELAAVHLRLAAMKEEEHLMPATVPEHVMAALSCVPGHPVALRELELLYLKAAHGHAGVRPALPCTPAVPRRGHCRDGVAP
jgi:tetratricopeptide (TPR) repeat protein